ncbi:ABC transporter ATP-binding protein [Modestobacter marinus]|uniref:ABC transporter ATP-binding protein n=1 Tax=Modestobacter marinus TaxID=477641 RepID=A0A846LG52_9ACTN|nr:ABC transporter ATP-binding protein [Modestobacter marinus]NIH67163.1 iron(III) transport system ATP-binding protein [Modestobacter marinus]GGL52541.1 ABC transporter ATP-binding protein [Modestobacter marinus]
MTMLTITNLVKSFGSEAGKRAKARSGSSKKGTDAGQDAGPARVFAVNDISLEVGEGEMFTLLGPSGCGKTTTLRAVAGLERPDSGRIVVGDRPLFEGGSTRHLNVPANQRGLGMVFQSYAIWPHMTVFDNVAFPLQVRKRATRPGKREIQERVAKVLETMELGHLADRQATKLSGGQQQRLALARAVVIEPPLMLLDEPLSNLDAKLRESLRYELKRLQRDLGITSIYVTHDQIEALALSTTIAVMKEGNVLQTGRPRQVYETPNSKFVAEFIGTSNFLRGTVAGREGGNVDVDTEAGRVRLESSVNIPVGEEVIAAVRPECLEISTTRWGNRPNEWAGTVTNRAFLGDAVDHIVRVGQGSLRVRGNPATSIEPGTEVYLATDPSKVTLVPVG